MPFLSHLAEQHERYLERYPVPPPEPTGPWTFIPDPLEHRRSLLQRAARALTGRRWR